MSSPLKALKGSPQRLQTETDQLEEEDCVQVELHPHEKMFKPEYYKPTRFSKSLIEQQEFYCENKVRGVQKLCEDVIDKEIRQKPYRLLQKVVEQAITQGEDIDNAALDY
jgi:hypothetical protein